MAEITVNAGTNVGPGHPAHSGEREGKEKVSVTLTFDPGENLQEAVEMYGEEVVEERWKRQVRRDLGNAIRSALNSDKTPEQVEEELSDWRPDVTRRGGGGSKDIEDQFKELSEEERREKLQRLMQIAEGE